MIPFVCSLSSLRYRGRLPQKETNSLTQLAVLGLHCKMLRGWIRGYVLMILPQVHLRKPCYDFYFL